VGYSVLVSAFACEPGQGSEPGVGWNAVCTLADQHRVVVLTRDKYRAEIEAELEQLRLPELVFSYYDVPGLPRWFKRSSSFRHLYYLLWQVGAYFAARALLEERKFDVVHHVTYGCYWQPSLLALLPVPFVWGPVGGGESTPRRFRKHLGATGMGHDLLRDIARWCGERNPLVRLTARRSAVALTSTPESAARLRELGARQIRMVTGQTAVSEADLARLDDVAGPPDAPVRFISIGRLLHWKGTFLGLRAFAQANIAGSEYWIVGTGPDRSRLEALAETLGIRDRVTFWGQLSRSETLAKLQLCHALVHPSLHDWSPTVCVEAMAAGRPVICLDVGGPAQQVDERTGFRISARSPTQAIRELAAAMARVATEPSLLAEMGRAARRRARENFTWEVRGREYLASYRAVAEMPARPALPGGAISSAAEADFAFRGQFQA
jgi:glycosyltransferase involved in cell wall biosynthesis